MMITRCRANLQKRKLQPRSGPPRSVRLQLAFDDMATCGWAAPQTKPRKDSVLASREIARAAIRLRAPVKQLRIGFLQLAEFRLG
jgi:hypothetical protein